MAYKIKCISFAKYPQLAKCAHMYGIMLQFFFILFLATMKVALCVVTV